jgi:DNA modification methylase
MTAIVTQGDARSLLLPDESVDLIVTSPPFLNLRSYQDGGAHMDDQIGTGTRDEFLAQLWAATAEMKRVLKPAGSIFVELGDSYTDKCLNMTPHRYAIGCVDRLGLIKRAEIVWSRTNGLPESVTDRVRRSHSVVFHFVKQPRYYSAVDEIREEHLASSVEHANRYSERARTYGHKRNEDRGDKGATIFVGNPLGKLPGSVWSIPTAPLTVPDHLGIDHFAAYPPELVRRIVLGWSPREVCTGCGEGRRPVAVTDLGRKERLTPVYSDSGGINGSARHGKGASTLGSRGPSAAITGYACACPAPTVTRTVTEFDYEEQATVTREERVPDPDWINPAPTTPGVVLDPFGGTGTSALVASCFGRVGISVDLSGDYCRLARWRTTDPGERARVLGVPKPPLQVDGQLGMFDGEAAS